MSREILNTVELVEKLQNSITNVIVNPNSLEKALELLPIMQESAIEIGEAIELEYRPEQAAVLRLEEYVELIFQMYQKVECIIAGEEYDAEELGAINRAMCDQLGKAKMLLMRLMGMETAEQIRTIHDRPKYADEVGIFSKKPLNVKVGIVIQGQIKGEDDYTFETVKLYRKLYPDCEIIVSTWEDEEGTEIYEEYGAHVVKNAKPVHPGYGNAAYQTISSYNGLMYAKSLGCEYLCKTRSDQRFYLPDLFAYLNDMLDRYPLRLKTAQKKRLIAVDITTLSHLRQYNICDMFIYGVAEDVIDYFSCPVDQRDFKLVEWTTPEAFARERFAEAWFATYYIEKLGFELKWTMEDSDYYQNELFIIIDACMIDLTWTKYNNHEYYGRRYNGSLEISGFMEWLAAQPKD